MHCRCICIIVGTIATVIVGPFTNSHWFFFCFFCLFCFFFYKMITKSRIFWLQTQSIGLASILEFCKRKNQCESPIYHSSLFELYTQRITKIFHGFVFCPTGIQHPMKVMCVCVCVCVCVCA